MRFFFMFIIAVCVLLFPYQATMAKEQEYLW